MQNTGTATDPKSPIHTPAPMMSAKRKRMADQAKRASELRILLGLWCEAMADTRQRARDGHAGSLVARDAGDHSLR